jgi:GR25 family glycosyltransferase involved in LPS biosynthesis
MWHNFFDRIVVLNLKHRRDRLFEVEKEMNKYKIPFELVEAIYHQDGRVGIYESIKSLFRHSIKENQKNILIFEDDVKILREDFNELMELCVEQLPEDWRIFHLGANLPDKTKVIQYSENLLQVKRALALHAVAFSSDTMKSILTLPYQVPIDITIANWIHSGGGCFCSYPLLATQKPGKSDILGFPIDYKSLIEDNYKEATRNLSRHTIL